MVLGRVLSFPLQPGATSCVQAVFGPLQMRLALPSITLEAEPLTLLPVPSPHVISSEQALIDRDLRPPSVSSSSFSAGFR